MTSVPLTTWRSEVNLFCGLTSFWDSNMTLSPAMQSIMSFLLTKTASLARCANTVLVKAIGSLLESIISMASGESSILLLAASDRISVLMVSALS